LPADPQSVARDGADDRLYGDHLQRPAGEVSVSARRLSRGRHRLGAVLDGAHGRGIRVSRLRRAAPEGQTVGIHELRTRLRILRAGGEDLALRVGVLYPGQYSVCIRISPMGWTVP